MKFMTTLITYQLVFFASFLSHYNGLDKKMDQVKNEEILVLLQNKLASVTPSGNGKALMLLPFQSEFKENKSQIITHFNTAGYQTEVYENEEASLDRFRGSFLADFDIVYISSHGRHDIDINNTKERESVPQIAVGPNTEAVDRVVYDALTLEEKQSTGRFKGGSFGVTAKWFKITSNGKKFNNTWVFINACHSSGVDSGENSFSSTFIDLGAAAYNGYSDYISVKLSNAIAEKTIAIFTSGRRFVEVKQNIKNDLGLKAYRYDLLTTTKIPEKHYNIGLLTANKGVNDGFYLTNQESEPNVDTAILNPNSGTKGTPVKFTVTIKSDFVNKVAHITFVVDKDKRRSKYKMKKVSSNTWEYFNLTAPKARRNNTSVFEYRCFDNNDDLLGSGFALFNFEE